MIVLKKMISSIELMNTKIQGREALVKPLQPTWVDKPMEEIMQTRQEQNKTPIGRSLNHQKRTTLIAIFPKTCSTQCHSKSLVLGIKKWVRVVSLRDIVKVDS
jgi:hypothetical protein